MPEPSTIWTLGHGTCTADEFCDLLTGCFIDTLVDVRSNPYSRYVPNANRENLDVLLARHGIQYVFMGKELGGKPQDPALLGPDGEPDYGKIEQTEAYRAGSDRLIDLAHAGRTCILCSEEDPARCHRGLLVAESLAERGLEVLHIRRDGSIEQHEDMTRRRTGGQLMLF